jgi:hypothetical protein
VGNGLVVFPVTQQLDEDGVDITPDHEKTRYLEARSGDHLMTPFQCELCHYRNIYSANPKAWDLDDSEILCYIHRCSLDALWSRETTTVGHNLREAMRGRRSARRFHFPGETAIPPMGPYPLTDTFGMKAAMVMLDRSLDPGKNARYVQWDTFRKSRSTTTNGSQAGVTGLEDTIGAYEKGRVWISKVPTHTFWFSRFAVGIHGRVGEIKRQDESVTIDVMHAMSRILESQWRDSIPSQRLDIARIGAWAIGGFCTGLRGEEQLRIEFSGTKKSLRWLEKEDPYFMFVVTGRTKGNKLSGAKFSVPCVNKTEGTGLMPGKWVRRLVLLMEEAGVTSGRLFQKQLDPPRLFEMEDGVMSILETIQATTDLIEDSVDVRDRYGLERSFRRGVSAHARNMSVDEDLIKAVNRWQKDPTRGAARLDMIELYSQANALTPLYLRYSRAL